MIFEKLQAMIAEQLCKSKDDITMDCDIIKDLGADSLDIVEMLMNIETEWNIVVDDSEVGDMKTIGDVVSFIESKSKR
ncbi:MAG: acyl carrier protein [Clostridia bacterium]